VRHGSEGVTDQRLSLAVTIRVRGFGLSGATTDPSSTSLEGLEGGGGYDGVR
jgi:hypothetical protein